MCQCEVGSIEEPQVIGKILAHLQKAVLDERQAELLLRARAAPGQVRLI
jgi:hypothetical protein